MPGVVCVLVMMEGFEVSMRSRMLPDSMRFGSFTIFCSPNSLIISSSLLCLLAVLAFVVCWLFQSMSVQTISQFEFRLSRDSAVISSRNAMSTPPPWAFLSFLMAS